MGMFDWYIPVPSLNCPNCNFPLDGWQGKEADRVLFVWKQGVAYPIDQDAFESNCGEEIRKQARLPEKFKIHNYCENCKGYRIEAICKTKNEVWTEVTEVKAEKINDLPGKWFTQE